MFLNSKKKRKNEGETEPEATQDQDQDDQGNWEEYDEDAWSRWHCDDEYTGKEESSKESSFAAVSEGKGIHLEAADSPSKEEKVVIKTSWKRLSWSSKMEEKRWRWSSMHKRKNPPVKKINSIKKIRE